MKKILILVSLLLYLIGCSKNAENDKAFNHELVKSQLESYFNKEADYSSYDIKVEKIDAVSKGNNKFKSKIFIDVNTINFEVFADI